MKLYFMGICGTAMGNAALLLRQAGHEVSGSDAGVYPPMSDVLAAAGVAVHEGYDPARLAALRPDLVVIGNAQSRGNPEVEWLLDERVFPVTSLPALLHDFLLRRRRNLVIAGTHGKTTTTALTAYLLRSDGADPGFLIGGVPQDPPEGNWLGDPGHAFVIEGDEYDSAFFDKRSKFIHYAPRIAVLGNLEFDHADIFRDLADYQRTFAHFVRLVPRNGWLLLNGDDDNLRPFAASPWTRVAKVGTAASNDLVVGGFSEGPEGSRFELVWKGRPWGKVRWSQSGLYNARNAAMAALAAGLERYPEDPTRLSLEPLARFRGVKRRQETLLSAREITVIEDFGHHPTALADTLEAFRSRFPGARLTAVFEPRSNTARTKVLQGGFTRALARADDVYLGAVNRAEKLSTAERFDTEAVVDALQSQGVEAHAFFTNPALLDALQTKTLPPGTTPRVVIFFSNGSFDGIIARYAAAAAASV